MKSLVALLFLWSALSWAAPSNHPPKDLPPISIEELTPWTLQTGETRTLSVEGMDRFTVSGKAVHIAKLPITAELPKNAAAPSKDAPLLLKAVEPGRTEVWIWTQGGPTQHLTILVQDNPRFSPTSGPNPLDEALKPLREVRATRSGDRVQIRGKIVTEAELARVEQLEASFLKQIDNQSEVAPELLALGRTRLQTWIEEAKLQPALRVEVLGGSLWVRGSAPDSPTRTSWEQKLKALFAGTHLDISSLPDPSRTLFFRVFLLEVKKSAFRKLGLNWPSHLAGTLAVQGGSLFWTQAPQIEVALDWLEGNGFGKVLSQPELVVKVPGDAELFAGGEIPLEIHSRGGSRQGSWIEWKPYGLSLKLKTLSSTTDQVRLDIASEISELDRANGSDHLPGIQASRLKTQVDARIGEPLFLSGLLQEKWGTQERGMPALSKIPVLGKLFGSEDFINQRSELVAVLLPLNAPPPAPARIEQEQQTLRAPQSTAPSSAKNNSFSIHRIPFVPRMLAR